MKKESSANDILSLEEMRDYLDPIIHKSQEKKDISSAYSKKNENASSAADMNAKESFPAEKEITGQLSFESPKLNEEEAEANKKLKNFLNETTDTLYRSHKKMMPLESAEKSLSESDVTISKSTDKETDNKAFSEKQLEEYRRFKKSRLQKAKEFVLNDFTLTEQFSSTHSLPLDKEDTQKNSHQNHHANMQSTSKSTEQNLAEPSLNILKKKVYFSTAGLAILSLISTLLPLLYTFNFPLPVFLTPEMLSPYLIINLIFLVCAVMLSKNTFKTAFIKLKKKEFSRELLMTLALSGCVLQNFIFLFTQNIYMIDNTNIFLLTPVGIITMFFYYLSKCIYLKQLITETAYIHQISNEKSCGAALVTQRQILNAFAGNASELFPNISINRQMQANENDVSIFFDHNITDRISSFLTPIAIILSIILAMFSLFMTQDFSVALTAFAASLCICVPFGYFFCILYPFKKTNEMLANHSAALLGFNLPEKYENLDAVLLPATTLFPENSVTLQGMRVFNKFPMDQSIIMAASILSSTNSILKNTFLQILLNQTDLLQKTDNIVLEDNLGISGWVKDKHVILGNQQMLKNHNIAFPDEEEIKNMHIHHNETVFLSVDGKLAACFSISLKAESYIYQNLDLLLNHQVSIIVQTVDPIITTEKLSEIFKMDRGIFKILPARYHTAYQSQAKPDKRLTSQIINDGSFSSFTKSVVSVKILAKTLTLNIVLMLASILLGVLFLFVLTALNQLSLFSSLIIIAYELIFCAAHMLIPTIKQI